MKIKPDIGRWYGLNVEGAKESVMDRIKHALSSIYSNEKIPMIVYERLEKELKPVRDFGFASEYYIASEITRVSREHGYLTRTTRQMGASYVFFLLGVTDINPLERHYHCGNCCYYEEAKAIDYGILSIEGEIKECPICGTEMEIVGEGIPFETYAGEGYAQIPNIGIHIAPEVYQYVFDRLVEIVGVNHILRGATIKGDDDENKSREISVDPSAIHLFPRNFSIDDVTSVVSLKDDRGESAIVSSDYDRYDLGMSFTTIDLIVDDSLSLLQKLGEETGYAPAEVPLSDPDTLQLIIKSDTDGIPVFEEEKTKRLISLTNSSLENNVCSYSSLCRVLAISNGMNRWWNDIERRKKLIAEGKLDNVVVYRDEVYADLLRRGFSTSEAENYTKYVRTGRLKEKMVDGMPAIDRLLEKGLDEEYVDSIANVDFLQSKPWVFSEMNIIMKIAYYKTHYPDQFIKVVE